MILPASPAIVSEAIVCAQIFWAWVWIEGCCCVIDENSLLNKCCSDDVVSGEEYKSEEYGKSSNE